MQAFRMFDALVDMSVHRKQNLWWRKGMAGEEEKSNVIPSDVMGRVAGRKTIGKGRG